jgi:phytoene desaturase
MPLINPFPTETIEHCSQCRSFARVRKAIIIGSGPAGLGSALRLAAKGYSVQVFESNAAPGGKLAEQWLNGFRFDMGPSLFTLPENVDDLFRLFGENPEVHFHYKKLDEVCRYFWDDGTRFTVKSGGNQFSQALAEQFGESPERIEGYLRQSADAYRITAPVFLHRPLPTWRSVWKAPVRKALMQMGRLPLSGTLNGINARHFSHPKTVQLFNRYATYNGSNPYSAPSMMMLISHLEHGMGAYLPEGGMYSIVRALYELAISKNVTFHFNTPVQRILHSDRKVRGVLTAEGEHTADVVVSNMDIHPTYRKLLPDIQAPEKLLRQEKSSSALIFYWGIGKSFPQLGLHNIFFSGDYQKEFNTLFESRSIADDPTVYINITSKHVPQDAPPGMENWFVMINVPHHSGQDWSALKTAARKNVLKKLSAALGEGLEPLIRCEDVLDPLLIESRTSSFGGALYGNASNNTFAAFLRHRNASKDVEGLYFCGGSVHPGGGIPLALFSAKIVGDLVPDA